MDTQREIYEWKNQESGFIVIYFMLSHSMAFGTAPIDLVAVLCSEMSEVQSLGSGQQ